MATDRGTVVQSALLRDELVRMRKERGLTQEQVASKLEWSPSKVIRLEGGRSSITKVDLDALLNEYGIKSESTRDRLHVLARGARERAWWDKYHGDVASAYIDYVGYEAGASFVRQFESALVPGLLQIPEYAEAVSIGSISPKQVDALVGLRLQRQSELAQRSVQPRRYFVVDEAVIRRHVGSSKDRAIMPNQLYSIADTAESDDLITVRVIPFAAGAHLGLFGPFTLLEFDGGLPDILYMDAGRGTLANMIRGGDLVTEFQDNFELLLEDALPADESIELIRRAAEEMS